MLKNTPLSPSFSSRNTPVTSTRRWPAPLGRVSRTSITSFVSDSGWKKQTGAQGEIRRCAVRSLASSDSLYPRTGTAWPAMARSELARVRLLLTRDYSHVDLHHGGRALDVFARD